MKKCGRAFLLYLKMSLSSPVITFFAVLVLILPPLWMGWQGVNRGSEEYSSMFSAMQFGVFGFWILALQSSVEIYSNKFFTSCSIAKQLFCTVPVVFVLCGMILYDAVTVTIAYFCLGKGEAADMLLVGAVRSVFTSIVVACIGKPSLEWVPLAWILLAIFWEEGFISILSMFPPLSLGLALLLAIGFYALGWAIAKLIVQIWWIKGNRFKPQNHLHRSLK